MSDNNQPGLYGKLPAYGDFLTRNLSGEFVQIWDEWMQCYVSGPKQQIGAGWLDVYLTSPIWRFVLSVGAADNHNWAGLVMPSIDRVGRYFPISIVKSFPTEISPVHFLFAEQGWYDALESLCLMALDEIIDVDELMVAIDDVPLERVQAYQATGHLGEQGDFVIGLADDDQKTLNASLAYMLNASLSADQSSFSLWQTSGSELIAPSIFCCRGLPAVDSVTAMIDGQWQARKCKIPYNLNS